MDYMDLVVVVDMVDIAYFVVDFEMNKLVIAVDQYKAFDFDFVAVVVVGATVIVDFLFVVEVVVDHIVVDILEAFDIEVVDCIVVHMD